MWCCDRGTVVVTAVHSFLRSVAVYIPVFENTTTQNEEGHPMEPGSKKPVTVAGRPQIPLVRPDIARKRMESGAERHFEPKVVFLGLLALQDPPRPAVPRAVQICREASIGVVMVTGDQPQTAAAIARDIGIITKTGRTEDDVIIAKLLCMFLVFSFVLLLLCCCEPAQPICVCFYS